MFLCAEYSVTTAGVLFARVLRCREAERVRG